MITEGNWIVLQGNFFPSKIVACSRELLIRVSDLMMACYFPPRIVLLVQTWIYGGTHRKLYFSPMKVK